MIKWLFPKKRYYLLFGHCDDRDLDSIEEYIKLHAVDKETALFHEYYTLLEFDSDSNLIGSTLVIDQDVIQENYFKGDWELLKYQKLNLNDYVIFKKNPKGLNFIGGNPPSNFVIPQHENIFEYQYLGCISNSDPLYSWLPFDLHITFPLFCGVYSVDLDYSIPNEPKILRYELGTGYEKYELDALKYNYRFQKVNFSTEKSKNDFSAFGNGGVPGWLQGQGLMRSSIDQRPMKFVCSLSENWNVEDRSSLPLIHSSFSEREHASHVLEYFQGEVYVFIDLENLLVSCVMEIT